MVPLCVTLLSLPLSRSKVRSIRGKEGVLTDTDFYAVWSGPTTSCCSFIVPRIPDSPIPHGFQYTSIWSTGRDEWGDVEYLVELTSRTATSFHVHVGTLCVNRLLLHQFPFKNEKGVSLKVVSWYSNVPFIVLYTPHVEVVLFLSHLLDLVHPVSITWALSSITFVRGLLKKFSQTLYFVSVR